MANPKNVRNFESILRVGGILTKGNGRNIGMKVINKTGSAIAADKLVAISGYDVTSKLPKIVLANAGAADLATDVFVTWNSISNAAVGNVFKGGTSAATLNTNFGTVGDPVYLDTTAGGFTGTVPADPGSRVQVVGYTMIKSATVGQIKWDIKPVTKTSNVDQTSDIKVLAATVNITSGTTGATLTSLTGFSWNVAAGATYQYEINLPCTMTTNCGGAVAFKLTTATLATTQYQTYAATASDNTTAVSTQGTTTTDQTKMFNSLAAAYTLINIKGSFVTTLGGSVALQVAQNTSHADTFAVLLGGYAKLTRVA